jgi:hypothetical protein
MSVKKISGVGGKFFGDLFNFFRIFEKPCYEFSKFLIFFVSSERGHEYLQLLCGTTSGGRKMDLSRLFENFDFFSNFFFTFFQIIPSKTMLHESFKHGNICFSSGGCFTPPACTKIKNSSCVTVKYGGWVGGSLVFGRWLREDPRTSDFFSIDTGGLNQTTLLKIKRIYIFTEPEGHQ